MTTGRALDRTKKILGDGTITQNSEFFIDGGSLRAVHTRWPARAMADARGAAPEHSSSREQPAALPPRTLIPLLAAGNRGAMRLGVAEVLTEKGRRERRIASGSDFASF